MPQLAIQVAVPVGGPDTLAVASPLNTAILAGSLKLRLLLKANAGISDIRPYYWHASAAMWVGSNSDGANPKAAAQCDAAKFNKGSETFWLTVGASSFWILVREAGAGTITSAFLDEVRDPVLG